ncbi:MAG: hypothetical protein HC792_04210 [Acaryochloridaceae cyanobacterium CSU_5_19]|nr:hypothetical protein [Acaryochloridaceae cyanobacterium CSU_5_19]
MIDPATVHEGHRLGQGWEGWVRSPLGQLCANEVCAEILTKNLVYLVGELTNLRQNSRQGADLGVLGRWEELVVTLGKKLRSGLPYV